MTKLQNQLGFPSFVGHPATKSYPVVAIPNELAALSQYGIARCPRSHTSRLAAPLSQNDIALTYVEVDR
jgi:hypothetical protein